MKRIVIALLLCNVIYSSASGQVAEMPDPGETKTKVIPPGTPFSLKISADKERPAFDLFVSNPGKLRLDIQIVDAERRVVVDTTFSSPQYGCRYNFEQMEDGLYTVVVTGGTKSVSQVVAINTVVSRSLAIQD